MGLSMHKMDNGDITILSIDQVKSIYDGTSVDYKGKAITQISGIESMQGMFLVELVDVDEKTKEDTALAMERGYALACQDLSEMITILNNDQNYEYSRSKALHDISTRLVVDMGVSYKNHQVEWGFEKNHTE